jgi:hypothetical protein
MQDVNLDNVFDMYVFYCTSVLDFILQMRQIYKYLR